MSSGPDSRPLPIYQSPKRKRDAPDTVHYSPAVSPFPARILTDSREYPLRPAQVHIQEVSENVGDGSPRSAVAGALQELDLHSGFVRRLDFMDAGRARKRVAMSKDEDELPDADAVKTSTADSETEPRGFADIPVSGPPCTSNKGTKEDRTPSPTPRAGIPTIVITTPRSTRSKSPPLHTSPEANPFTWHDSEITGHKPSDPTDDGYGINGIGFRPTAAIAWARTQKRKQQVADYRTREAREARARRTERRRVGNASGTVSPVESPKSKKGKVRFDGPVTEVKDTTT